MCGIACYWAREAVLNRWDYRKLIEGCMLRGQDGLGVTIYNPKIPKYVTFTGKYVTRKSVGIGDDIEDFLNFIVQFMQVGSILLIASRATPETEPNTTYDMLQPIDKYLNLLLIHNGGVTDTIAKELESKPIYSIDSELILHSYLIYNKNMKNTMESLTGSFAFVMVDTQKEKLYAVTSFNPLAHGYIRGYGYFLHSDLESIGLVLRNLTGATVDGMNVWESWYHHYIEGYTIIETDIHSGFQHKSTYTPRFLHPTWNCLNKESKVKALVCASGGVDSGVTAAILKATGMEVELIHFKYGAKSEQAEWWAVSKLSDSLNIPLKIIDLTEIFIKLSAGGMLTDGKVKIDSGGDKIKSTIAWVPGRNAIFASIIMALAEQDIIEHNYSKVYISAGWSQLSEETGGYPDNSFQFTQSINNLKDYGYITGSRIEFLPVLQRLTKTETWKLGAELKFPFEYTVSCDNPKLKLKGEHEYVAELCLECGSTRLSCIAADRANIFDPRIFNKERPLYSKPTKVASIDDLIGRLILPEGYKGICIGGFK